MGNYATRDVPRLHRDAQGDADRSSSVIRGARRLPYGAPGCGAACRPLGNSNHRPTNAENHHLAKKPNYEFEKRKKELEKKAKKEEKRQRKLENANNPDDAALDAPDTNSPAPTE
jgi:hypothetical protein